MAGHIIGQASGVRQTSRGLIPYWAMTTHTSVLPRAWPRAIVAVVCLILGAAAPPAARSAEPLDNEGDPRFRLEWSAGSPSRPGTSLEGYLYNNDSHRIGLIQLKIEVLDEAGTVVSVGRGWVYGDVLAGGRAPFSVRPPVRGASYRISVNSFVRISRESREAP